MADADRPEGAAVVSASPLGFEGTEKTLWVEAALPAGDSAGFRALDRKDWVALLAVAQCSILRAASTPRFDAYVLSESSLFVFPHKVVLKTCGATTLLRALPVLLERAAALALRVLSVVFARKNLIFPDWQHFPHRSIDEEVAFLRTLPIGPLRSVVLGHEDDDHVLVCVARPDEEDGDDDDDDDAKEAAARSATLDAAPVVTLMMYGIPDDVAHCFTQEAARQVGFGSPRSAEGPKAAGAPAPGTCVSTSPEASVSVEEDAKDSKEDDASLGVVASRPSLAPSASSTGPRAVADTSAPVSPRWSSLAPWLPPATPSSSLAITAPADSSGGAHLGRAGTDAALDTPFTCELGRRVTRHLGLDRLLPGSELQEHLFEPHGFSLNGLREDGYWTLHVTPEPQCSYVSFETSIPVDAAVLEAVLRLFRPQRASVLVLGPSLTAVEHVHATVSAGGAGEALFRGAMHFVGSQPSGEFARPAGEVAGPEAEAEKGLGSALSAHFAVLPRARHGGE